MKRTTIFVEPELWELLSRVAEEERGRGRKVTRSELIREAVRRYLAEIGYSTEERAEKIRRAISSYGTLGEDFERAVREAGDAFEEWKPDCA